MRVVAHAERARQSFAGPRDRCISGGISMVNGVSVVFSGIQGFFNEIQVGTQHFGDLIAGRFVHARSSADSIRTVVDWENTTNFGNDVEDSSSGEGKQRVSVLSTACRALKPDVR